MIGLNRQFYYCGLDRAVCGTANVLWDDTLYRTAVTKNTVTNGRIGRDNATSRPREEGQHEHIETASVIGISKSCSALELIVCILHRADGSPKRNGKSSNTHPPATWGIAHLHATPTSRCVPCNASVETSLLDDEAGALSDVAVPGVREMGGGDAESASLADAVASGAEFLWDFL